MPRPTREYQLVSDFKGYRHREDITNMPPGYLVPGSLNVLTNFSDRIAVRKGYTLDGQNSSSTDGVMSSYDWSTHLGTERHLRSFGTTLQYRYVYSDGTVEWRDLMTSLSSPNFNYAEFWDTTELFDVLLFVNGEANINEWSGGLTTFASATANTITKQGTTSWAEEDFYTAGTRSVVIDGITYTYTGGESTTTLTGVTPDPTLGGHVVGDVIHQSVRTTANPVSLPLTQNDLIATLYNQVYVGAFNNRTVYVSEQNNYLDYTFSNPRAVGEGAEFILDGTPIGFVPAESEMYITAGTDQWYRTAFTLSSDLSNESLEIERLKTTVLQAAISQALITTIKNNIAFISQEKSMDFLGKSLVQSGIQTSMLNDPTITDMSDPIKFDFDNYDFDNGSAKYFQNFTYVAVPAEGVVRVYNHIKEYWEAPLTLPISRFAIIDGELYGHSYLAPVTYKLFNGTSDAGNAIAARAIFSYQNFGSRVNLKRFINYYIEGYISSNTTLTARVRYEIDGCGSTAQYNILGSDTQIVCSLGDDGSLGKQSLGKRSLAGRAETSQFDNLPPKFRVIKTGAGTDFYEVQFSFESDGADQRWELLAFGPEIAYSDHDSVAIKQ